MATLAEQLAAAQRQTNQVGQSGFKGLLGFRGKRMQRELEMTRSLLAEQSLQQIVMAQQADAEAQQQAAPGMLQSLQAQGIDTREIPGLLGALEQGGANVANALAANPQAPLQQGIQRMQMQQGMQAQQEQMAAQQMQRAKLEAQRLANTKNREALRSGGFSPSDIAGVELSIRGSARSLASLSELETISNMDVNLLKGGAAAMTNYITQTLQPTIMELIQTGVINSPSEQERVMSFLPSLTGRDGLITFDTTNKAKIRGFARWLLGKQQDQADAYGLDLSAYGNSYNPRSAEELDADIQAFDADVPTSEARQAQLDEGFEPIDTDAMGILGDALFPRGKPDLTGIGDAAEKMIPRR